MNNALLRTNLPAGLTPERYGIVTVNHPMNRTRKQLELNMVLVATREEVEGRRTRVFVLSLTLSDRRCHINCPDIKYNRISFFNASLTIFYLNNRESSAVDLLIAISVIIAMSFIPATFILFLTEERASSSKLMQMVSGVRPYIYWLSTFTWDMVRTTP